MSSPIRVVMADDSSAVRCLMTNTLNKHDDLEVVRAARDGKQALEAIAELKPDVVLLDIEMPVMDGIDALREIRRQDKVLPILMFSSLTVKGGQATLEALSLGANDYVAKPRAAEKISDAVDYIDAELVPRIRQWGRPQVSPAFSAGPSVAVSSAADVGGSTDVRPAKESVDIVAVGASTGGPNALSDLVSGLPSGFSCPIVVVQHMPALFTGLLAERLDRQSSLTVKEAEDGCRIGPGEVWIAPGGFHMTVARVPGGSTELRLNEDFAENSCRPSVDVLFRSVAEAFGSRSLGVILTGMGRDGLEGCREIRNRGGAVIAQDQASSVVWGMPRAVIESQLATRVLALGQIGSEIAAASCSRRPVFN